MNLRERYQREFYPISMDGCVLYLPFSRDTGQGGKIYDISGLGNHGVITGAVPACYPILSHVELLSNGTFTGSADGWTVGAAWAYNANAVDKNADGITTLSQTGSISSGKRYKLSFWISNWTVGTVTPSCGGFTGTARGADGYYEEIFVASSTADLVFTPTNTSRFTIDTVSLQEIVGYESLGLSFDGVDDVITVADHASLDISDNLTLLAWVYHKSPIYAYIMSKMTGIADANIAALQYLDVKLNFLITTTGTGWQSVGQSIYLTDKSWNCIAVTYSSTLGGTTYLDGAATGASSAADGTIMTNNMTLDIGGSNLGSYGNLIWGDFLLFNRYLTLQEIKDYYENTRWRYGR